MTGDSLVVREHLAGGVAHGAARDPGEHAELDAGGEEDWGADHGGHEAAHGHGDAGATLVLGVPPVGLLLARPGLGARAGRCARGGGRGAGGQLDNLVIAEQGDGTRQPGGVATLYTIFNIHGRCISNIRYR